MISLDYRSDSVATGEFKAIEELPKEGDFVDKRLVMVQAQQEQERVTCKPGWMSFSSRQTLP